ncbi:transcription factor bHLH113-like protein [Carex littledalei]|uniref:Transcription factor bHLH113-like protein n=1 Tax=Carex littledalei TaxID=544730 RepID=A0A833RLA3_9POAL|nr:transcription factor bHLH113-like protein [Carex littledalei]
MLMTQATNHKRRYNYNDNYLFSGNNTSTSVGLDYEDTVASKRIKSGTGIGTALPPKEKKDKIGEKIASLQKLVSPFGKSDTASVLQEASGYIKFLHDQIQVLSSPYLRSPFPGNVEDPEYYSLIKRGLCLMPVELTLGVARSNGADLWAPINSRSSPINR